MTTRTIDSMLAASCVVSQYNCAPPVKPQKKKKKKCWQQHDTAGQHPTYTQKTNAATTLSPGQWHRVAATLAHALSLLCASCCWMMCFQWTASDAASAEQQPPRPALPAVLGQDANQLQEPP
jgi:hypothetical protein